MATAVASARDVSIEEELARLVAVSAEVREEVAKTGADIDLKGRDPGPEMQLVSDRGLNMISLPRAYGGLSDGRMTFATEATMRMAINLSAGDGSVGQNFVVNQLVTREIFNPHHHVPEATLSKLAAELKAGVRFVASNSEAGSKKSVTLTRVDGGLVLDGTKTFNSNSGGGGYANVGAKLDGKQHHAIVPLDQPGIVQHRDWDVMGQRGTYSQTIDYNQVFVPDGWHYASEFPPSDGRLLSWVFLVHASLMLGTGMGAFDAMCAHVRKNGRVLMPGFASAAEDPIAMLHIGNISVGLRSAEALFHEVARRVDDQNDTDLQDIEIDAMRVKVACVKASMPAGEELFELTGARSTANKYRYDRFWRNIRTFAVHDSTDAKTVWIGGWSLDRIAPPSGAALRV